MSGDEKRMKKSDGKLDVMQAEKISKTLRASVEVANGQDDAVEQPLAQPNKSIILTSKQIQVNNIFESGKLSPMKTQTGHKR